MAEEEWKTLKRLSDYNKLKILDNGGGGFSGCLTDKSLQSVLNALFGVPVPKNAKLLDIGCSVGKPNLFAAAKYGVSGGGFDTAAYAVEMFKQEIQSTLKRASTPEGQPLLSAATLKAVAGLKALAVKDGLTLEKLEGKLKDGLGTGFTHAYSFCESWATLPAFEVASTAAHALGCTRLVVVYIPEKDKKVQLNRHWNLVTEVCDLRMTATQGFKGFVYEWGEISDAAADDAAAKRLARHQGKLVPNPGFTRLPTATFKSRLPALDKLPDELEIGTAPNLLDGDYSYWVEAKTSFTQVELDDRCKGKTIVVAGRADEFEPAQLWPGAEKFAFDVLPETLVKVYVYKIEAKSTPKQKCLAIEQAADYLRDALKLQNKFLWKYPYRENDALVYVLFDKERQKNTWNSTGTASWQPMQGVQHLTLTDPGPKLFGKCKEDQRLNVCDAMRVKAEFNNLTMLALVELLSGTSVWSLNLGECTFDSDAEDTLVEAIATHSVPVTAMYINDTGNGHREEFGDRLQKAMSGNRLHNVMEALKEVKQGTPLTGQVPLKLGWLTPHPQAGDLRHKNFKTGKYFPTENQMRGWLRGGKLLGVRDGDTLELDWVNHKKRTRRHYSISVEEGYPYTNEFMDSVNAIEGGGVVSEAELRAAKAKGEAKGRRAALIEQLKEWPWNADEKLTQLEGNVNPADITAENVLDLLKTYDLLDSSGSEEGQPIPDDDDAVLDAGEAGLTPEAGGAAAVEVVTAKPTSDTVKTFIGTMQQSHEQYNGKGNRGLNGMSAEEAWKLQAKVDHGVEKRLCAAMSCAIEWKEQLVQLYSADNPSTSVDRVTNAVDVIYNLNKPSVYLGKTAKPDFYTGLTCGADGAVRILGTRTVNVPETALDTAAYVDEFVKRVEEDTEFKCVKRNLRKKHATLQFEAEVKIADLDTRYKYKLLDVRDQGYNQYWPQKKEYHCIVTCSPLLYPDFDQASVFAKIANEVKDMEARDAAKEANKRFRLAQKQQKEEEKKAEREQKALQKEIQKKQKAQRQEIEKKERLKRKQIEREDNERIKQAKKVEMAQQRQAEKDKMAKQKQIDQQRVKAQRALARARAKIASALKQRGSQAVDQTLIDTIEGLEKSMRALPAEQWDRDVADLLTKAKDQYEQFCNERRAQGTLPAGKATYCNPYLRDGAVVYAPKSNRSRNAIPVKDKRLTSEQFYGMQLDYNVPFTSLEEFEAAYDTQLPQLPQEVPHVVKRVVVAHLQEHVGWKDLATDALTETLVHPCMNDPDFRMFLAGIDTIESDVREYSKTAALLELYCKVLLRCREKQRIVDTNVLLAQDELLDEAGKSQREMELRSEHRLSPKQRENSIKDLQHQLARNKLREKYRNNEEITTEDRASVGAGADEDILEVLLSKDEYEYYMDKRLDRAGVLKLSSMLPPDELEKRSTYKSAITVATGDLYKLTDGGLQSVRLPECYYTNKDKISVDGDDCCMFQNAKSKTGGCWVWPRFHPPPPAAQAAVDDQCKHLLDAAARKVKNAKSDEARAELKAAKKNVRRVKAGRIVRDFSASPQLCSTAEMPQIDYTIQLTRRELRDRAKYNVTFQGHQTLLIANENDQRDHAQRRRDVDLPLWRDTQPRGMIVLSVDDQRRGGGDKGPFKVPGVRVEKGPPTAGGTIDEVRAKVKQLCEHTDKFLASGQARKVIYPDKSERKYGELVYRPRKEDEELVLSAEAQRRYTEPEDDQYVRLVCIPSHMEISLPEIQAMGAACLNLTNLEKGARNFLRFLPVWWSRTFDEMAIKPGDAWTGQGPRWNPGDSKSTVAAYGGPPIIASTGPIPPEKAHSTLTVPIDEGRYEEHDTYRRYIDEVNPSWIHTKEQLRDSPAPARAKPHTIRSIQQEVKPNATPGLLREERDAEAKRLKREARGVNEADFIVAEAAKAKRLVDPRCVYMPSALDALFAPYDSRAWALLHLVSNPPSIDKIKQDKKSIAAKASALKFSVFSAAINSNLAQGTKFAKLWDQMLEAVDDEIDGGAEFIEQPGAPRYAIDEKDVARLHTKHENESSVQERGRSVEEAERILQTYKLSLKDEPGYPEFHLENESLFLSKAATLKGKTVPDGENELQYATGAELHKQLSDAERDQRKGIFDEFCGAFSNPRRAGYRLRLLRYTDDLEAAKAKLELAELALHKHVTDEARNSNELQRLRIKAFINTIYNFTDGTIGEHLQTCKADHNRITLQYDNRTDTIKCTLEMKGQRKQTATVREAMPRTNQQRRAVAIKAFMRPRSAADCIVVDVPDNKIAISSDGVVGVANLTDAKLCASLADPGDDVHAVVFDMEKLKGFSIEQLSAELLNDIVEEAFTDDDADPRDLYIKILKRMRSGGGEEADYIYDHLLLGNADDFLIDDPWFDIVKYKGPLDAEKIAELEQLARQDLKDRNIEDALVNRRRSKEEDQRVHTLYLQILGEKFHSDYAKAIFAERLKANDEFNPLWYDVANNVEGYSRDDEDVRATLQEQIEQDITEYKLAGQKRLEAFEDEAAAKQQRAAGAGAAPAAVKAGNAPTVAPPFDDLGQQPGPAEPASRKALSEDGSTRGTGPEPAPAPPPRPGSEVQSPAEQGAQSSRGPRLKRQVVKDFSDEDSSADEEIAKNPSKIRRFVDDRDGKPLSSHQLETRIKTMEEQQGALQRQQEQVAADIERWKEKWRQQHADEETRKRIDDGNELAAAGVRAITPGLDEVSQLIDKFDRQAREYAEEQEAIKKIDADQFRQNEFPAKVETARRRARAAKQRTAALSRIHEKQLVEAVEKAEAEAAAEAALQNAEKAPAPARKRPAGADEVEGAQSKKLNSNFIWRKMLKNLLEDLKDIEDAGDCAEFKTALQVYIQALERSPKLVEFTSDQPSEQKKEQKAQTKAITNILSGDEFKKGGKYGDYDLMADWIKIRGLGTSLSVANAAFCDLGGGDISAQPRSAAGRNVVVH